MQLFVGQTYIVGPLVTLVMVGVLALVLRWAYGSSPGTMPVINAGGEFGLLREAALVEDAGEANALRAVLSDADIRSTVAPGSRGRTRVLVFERDLEAARRVLGPMY
jgi:hypothetical protein